MKHFHALLKKGLALLVICCCADAYAQQPSIYDDFSTEALLENKYYVKNFNPIDFDPDILNACIIDIINMARAQYTHAEPLVENDILAAAADFQSQHMAKKEEKSYINQVSYLKHTEDRGFRAGGTKKVSEVVTRVKATKGSGKEDYSYLDVATETVMSILKSNKIADIPLNKKFKMAGVSVSVDNYNKYCYVSIVLGNDLSFNKPDITYKHTTYTRKSYGLAPYNAKTCRKCNIRNVEEMHKGLEIKGGDIYFRYPNVRELRRIIGNKKDGIALDIVQHSQFPCNSTNDVDNNLYNRGVMTKYITYAKLVKKNQVTDKKDKSLYVYLGSVPAGVSEPFDVNLILIKDKTVCRTLCKTNVSVPQSVFQSQTSLVPDLTGIKTTINYIPKPEKAVFEFKIPFEQNKSDYKAEDIQPFIDALHEARFNIDSLHIATYTSLEGGERSNLELQKKRSESIMKAMRSMQNRDIPYSVGLNDGYDLFVRDVRNTEYSHLANKSKEEAVAALQNARTRKALESMLKEHRYTLIEMHVTYDVSEKYEQDFVTRKFNKALEENNFPLAFAIEKYYMKRVEDGKYNKELIDSLRIPYTQPMVPFLTNKYYMLSYFPHGLSSEDLNKVMDMPKMSPKNTIVEFNALACEVLGKEITAPSQITTLQSKIDKFYNTDMGKKYPHKVDALNIVYQYKILDYINSSENPDDALMDNTYAKIKSIAAPTISNWKKAMEVAASFISYGDYEFARATMDPFIKDPKVSEDFVFTYLSLYAMDENCYTSANFDIACKLAAERNAQRFCKAIQSFTYLVRENVEAKKIICKTCK
jgi:hypothetical protein